MCRLFIEKSPTWWCVDGTMVVDPTASQFFGLVEKYEEFDPDIHGAEPVGKCLNCGEYVRHPVEFSRNFCNQECFDSEP